MDYVLSRAKGIRPAQKRLDFGQNDFQTEGLCQEIIRSHIDGHHQIQDVYKRQAQDHSSLLPVIPHNASHAFSYHGRPHQGSY